MFGTKNDPGVLFWETSPKIILSPPCWVFQGETNEVEMTPWLESAVLPFFEKIFNL